MTRISSKIGDGIAIASAVTALTIPPGANCAIVDSWNSDDIGTIPKFDLEIWATGARGLTNAVLYGAHLHPLVFADITVTANNTTNEFAAVAHGRLTGDGPAFFTTTGTFPGGTDGVTPYYVVEGSDADHFKIALTRNDALKSTNLVDLTSDGTGTIKLVDDPTTKRVHWHSHGMLGLLDDGVVDLTAQKSYMTRGRHSPRAIAYAISATFDGGPGQVSAQLFPIDEGP